MQQTILFKETEIMPDWLNFCSFYYGSKNGTIQNFLNSWKRNLLSYDFLDGLKIVLNSIFMLMSQKERI